MRWFGLDRESGADFRCSQSITVRGLKAHMNDIAASIGLANLEGLDDRVARQIEVAHAYKQMGLPLEVDCDSHHWVAFLHVQDRVGFQNFMSSRNIGTSLVHSRNDRHSVFSGAVSHNLHGLEEFARTYIAIPCGWWLTDEKIKHIASSVLEWQYHTEGAAL
jgi:dTDP-4-amino-4,6-dideoxygalactose transaminase